MKDMKFDFDKVYEQNPFKKYINHTLKKELDMDKQQIKELVD